MRPVAGNYSNVEASIGSIARWTSSSIRGIKGSNSSSREYEQRLAKKKMETQPGHQSNILMRSSSVPDFESNEMFG